MAETQESGEESRGKLVHREGGEEEQSQLREGSEGAEILRLTGLMRRTKGKLAQSGGEIRAHCLCQGETAQRLDVSREEHAGVRYRDEKCGGRRVYSRSKKFHLWQRHGDTHTNPRHLCTARVG